MSLPIEVNATSEQPLGMSADAFLRDYWQKAPLLVRQAYPNFVAPLEPDDLGGLALEDGVLARLVEYHRAEDRWTIHHGPLDADIFQRLPDRDWTLLVQDVDKWDDDVARLWQDFSFFPNWRLDDIMVSYAEDQGGVGAHIDQYDVFLLQGYGQRRWRIDTSAQPDASYRDDVPLRLLQHFRPTHDWILNPGDMLYLPPGVPHDGVAVGACMTFSLGLRAPSRAELLFDFVSTMADHMCETERYADADLAVATKPGEISPRALQRVAATLGASAQLADSEQLMQWFGTFITQYRVDQLAAAPPHSSAASSLRTAIHHAHKLHRHPWTRIAWSARDSASVHLFVTGHHYLCSEWLACTLAGERHFTLPDTLSESDFNTVLDLLNAGHLVLEAH